MRISGWLLVNAFTGVFADPVGSSCATGDQGRDCGGGNAARAAASLPLKASSPPCLGSRLRLGVFGPRDLEPESALLREDSSRSRSLIFQHSWPHWPVVIHVERAILMTSQAVPFSWNSKSVAMPHPFSVC